MCGIAKALYLRRDELKGSLPENPERIAGAVADGLRETVSIDRLVGFHAETCEACRQAMEGRAPHV